MPADVAAAVANTTRMNDPKSSEVYVKVKRFAANLKAQQDWDAKREAELKEKSVADYKRCLGVDGVPCGYLVSSGEDRCACCGNAEHRLRTSSDFDRAHSGTSMRV